MKEMSVGDMFSYAGKRVAIVGCFSGLGEACARELVARGAEVHGADIKSTPVEVASFTQVDLKDWSSIDKAVSSIGGEIDALFNCAGLPQTFAAADVVSVNYLGIRHWTEQWLPNVRSGGAIVSISSLGGMAYLSKLETLKPLIEIGDHDTFHKWMAANPEVVGDGYALSKELINLWSCLEAVKQAPRGIRINTTMPSPTQTPMMADFEKIVPAAFLDIFTAPSGRRSSAEQQANPLIFLNSEAASFISGVCLPVDFAFFSGVCTGALDMQAMMAKAAE
jgi:NAD(P)-dependent dehydrogenase (short-subunit alcohol dehydrogenase family)